MSFFETRVKLVGRRDSDCLQNRLAPASTIEQRRGTSLNLDLSLPKLFQSLVVRRIRHEAQKCGQGLLSHGAAPGGA